MYLSIRLLQHRHPQLIGILAVRKYDIPAALKHRDTVINNHEPQTQVFVQNDDEYSEFFECVETPETFLQKYDIHGQY